MTRLAIILGIWIAIGMGITVPVPDFRDYDSTDDAVKGERSGLKLYIDHETGCEYISSFFGSLSLRLDSKGKHICRKQYDN